MWQLAYARIFDAIRLYRYVERESARSSHIMAILTPSVQPILNACSVAVSTCIQLYSISWI
jgi:hypothetical protein